MDKQLLWEKLIEINEDIDNHYDLYNQVGGLAGLSGLALFKFYYSKLIDNPNEKKKGEEILKRCIENINNGFSYPTYCAGLAGMGWVLDHLKEGGFIYNECDDMLFQLDGYLNQIMTTNIKDGKFDFLHEALGYAFYFLNRYKTTSNTHMKLFYQSSLLDFVKNLKEQSKRNKLSNSVEWISVLDYQGKTRGYNLSLSHGISSIIGFLARLHRQDFFTDECEDLLNGSVEFVLSYMGRSANGISVFPDWISLKGQPLNVPSRLGWCYGDLGIGISLWSAYKSTGQQKIKDASIHVFKESSKRKSYEQNLVVDAGLCHGSFGISQIYNRMYHEMKSISDDDMEIDFFLQEANFWAYDGLTRANHNGGFAGFKEWKGTAKRWVGSHFVLTGTAGIGLAIISNLSTSSEFEPNWDACLMIA